MLKYPKIFESEFVIKKLPSWLDKIRKKSLLFFKKNTNTSPSPEEKNMPLNLRGLPSFLTLTDKKDYLNQLFEEAKSKKFNLLTNLYFENTDPNIDVREKLKIFEGKYMRTYLINKFEIGKFRTYNTDPKSAEFQQLIVDSAKSTDYFKIVDYFVNGYKTSELNNQIKLKTEQLEKEKLIESKLIDLFNIFF